MREQDLINQKQAAAIFGRSVSAISRAVKTGRLEYVDPKRRLFSRPGLEVRYPNHTRRRVDQPMVKTQNLGSRPSRSDPVGSKDQPDSMVGRPTISLLGNSGTHVPEFLPFESAPERTIPETYWERVADKLDCVLQGCSNYWPQYDAERLRVFARALDEVRDQTEMEGLTSF